ncbi:metallophosphoesterase [Staphylococcus petrasii]|uniref:Metallophosphoesterase n=1 Tax=Staphylococcus petrasii TaxID=1276936 RepID=A0A380FZA1_9STAP|nr:metallophosphoesterase family protein [Staphylococcus petrasii]PNZ24097.1 metallophosphoesterase [Staphylococcus petrasii]TGE11501.1 metallophosphoesterase [Staphylococcus petrasii]TGE14793.1 metallophosphoesterase [Staphylococcus petrasii]SUM43318.1 metallophosphoesterase [Staphylococcus petrasii]
MKFAIITDVHGNFDALQTVLEDIDNRGDIDKIYNLGDNIGIGHETNKVLDTIFDRDDMEIIAGNHDEAVMSLVNNTPYPEDLKDKFYEHHQWIESHMDEDYFDQLNLLPRRIETTICGKKFLFIHYEIENDKFETRIDEQPFSPIVNNEKESIKELFNDKEADFIAFGHNHQLHLYDDNETIYFNPGSVGLNNGANTVYGIVTVTENRCSVERVKLAYDNEEFLQGFKEKKVPAKQLIFDQFL